MFKAELDKTLIFTKKILKIGENPFKKQGNISQFIHVINCFKKIGCLSKSTDSFTGYIELLNNEVRIIRNIWAHDGGVDLKGKLSEPITGISIMNNQVNISSTYIKEVGDIMRYVSKEIIESVSHRLENTK